MEGVAETSILVVAGHALVREGLRSVLRATPGLYVVAEADDLSRAFPIAAKFKPDVMLLAEAPDDAIQLAELSRLRRELPTTCVLCLANSPNGSRNDKGNDADKSWGDILCVPSSAGIGELCSVLGRALGGRCAGCLLKPNCVAPQIAVALSRRERQVAVSVARGMSSKQIAGALGIALRTVNTYRESLAKKIGASSGAVLTRFVLEAKLDTTELLGPPL